jgi:hypothetical protein
MDSETKQLRALVAAWEKKKRHAEKMVARLRSALDLLHKHGAAPPETSRRAGRPKKAALAAVPTLPPFTPKYSRPSKEYIRDVLTEKGESTLPAIRNALAGRGIVYTVQALTESMKAMERAGWVRRRRAPRGTGSGSLFLWSLTRQVSQGGGL